MSALANKYRNDLLRSDINPIYIDTIYERAGAFSHCVAVMDSFVKIKDSHKDIYKEKKKKGYNQKTTSSLSGVRFQIRICCV